MWNKFAIALGVLTTALTDIYGGWGNQMNTLLICMVADYIIAVICCLVGVSKNADKGGFNSAVGWKGLVSKAISLIVILIAHRVDLIWGYDYCRNAVTTGFILNEVISIVENCGLLGVPLPNAVKQMLDVLKSTADKEGDEINGMDSGK